MNVIKILQNTRCSSCKLHAIQRNYHLNSILYSTASKDEIVIPKRIPRGPTDILKALASVTKRDPTAAHYKFHDDPYLIPASNHQKRIYALAQESGRKAAKWIRDENPALFQHVESEPPIEAYFPRARYNETDELDNEILFKIIHSGLLNDAVTVYKIMKKRGDEISEENKQALLELVSFFNETEEIDEEFIEEKWYSQTAKENAIIKKTWKDVGLAQELFDELPESAKSYSALIKGMTKYHQVDKAFQYFKLAEEKGIVLSTDAYNSLIRVSFYMADGEQQRWEIIENLLKTMNDHGLPPNLLTLNSVLFSLSRVRVSKDTKRYALKMLAEVKQFGVQPSLATYYHMLNIFYSDKSSTSSIMQEILNDLENREITIQDPMDINFFYLAMEKCRYHLRDADIAHRLNQLLWHKNNYNFIGNSYKEASFYRNYFFLLVQTELMENIMRIYNFLVPHIYTPEISVMEELIKCATMNGAVDLYARFWADVVAFEMQEKIQILSALLEGMMLNQPPSTIPPNQTAIDFAKIAWSVFESTESKSQQKSIIIEWTGKMLGELIVLLVHGGEYRRAIQVFKKLIKDQNHILGVPEPGVFMLFVDACIKHDDLKQAMELVAYSSENGYEEAKPIAKKILKSFSLSPAYQTQLTVLVGPDIFNDEEVEKSTA